MIIKKVLCVCKGNGDRSPFMAAVLQMYWDESFKLVGQMSEEKIKQSLEENVLFESAGILEIADKGGSASSFMIKAAKRIGIDLSSHKRRWVNSLHFKDYDLFVCVDEEVAAYVIGLGVDIKKVCNAQVPNPWPSQFQRDHDDTAGRIMDRMFHVITRYFSSE